MISLTLVIIIISIITENKAWKLHLILIITLESDGDGPEVSESQLYTRMEGDRVGTVNVHGKTHFRWQLSKILNHCGVGNSPHLIGSLGPTSSALDRHQMHDDSFYVSPF